MAAAPSVADDDARTVIGEWVGTYTCAQGLTGITLTISEASAVSARAHFLFYADPRNTRRVPTGCFTMNGGYDPSTGRLQLKPESWLLRPGGYQLVGFTGDVDAAGSRFEGGVTRRGCGTFELERRPSPIEVPEQCAVDVAAPQDDLATAGAIGELLRTDGAVDLNILFDFGAATVSADGLAQLDELGRLLSSPEFANRRVGLYGHTDAVGSEHANRELSVRRVSAVREHLEQRFRIPSGRFDVDGFGESRLKIPAAPDDARNRRVEVVLLD